MLQLLHVVYYNINLQNTFKLRFMRKGERIASPMQNLAGGFVHVLSIPQRLLRSEHLLALS